MTDFKQIAIGLLPTNWAIKRIDEVYDFKNKPKGANFEKVKQVPFIPMNLIPDNRLFVRDFELRDISDISSGTYIENGDLLIAKITPSFENGKQAIVDFEHKFGFATTEVIPIKEKEKISNKQYLYYYLLKRDIRSFLAGKMEGSTGRQRLSKTILGETLIPFPPISEQNTIVHILSKIQSAIETQEKIIQTTTKLKKALMQKLFTEGLRGEPQREDSALKWDKVKLGSLAEKGIVEFQNGFPCGQWNESGVGIPQLRPFNVTDFGKIDLTQIKSIETNKSVEKYKLKQNDIVFNNTNSEELVGKTALWQNGDGYVLSNHMTIIRIKDNTSINPTYLANFLHKKWFDGHYKMVCRRHVNQASVSIERLKDMDLPYPQIDVQDEIAKSFISIDKKIEFANAKHQTLQVLFKSMLYHLMTGQIRVKDLKFS